MNTIKFKETLYPKFQSEGFASQFAVPYARHFCIGEGYDIGCNREEWKFPGAEPIDPVLNQYDALNLPDKKVDYIFSSHCLEHLPNWVETLDYWIKHLKNEGVLFLYLPHFDQEYWRPWNNRKHIHSFTPELIKSYLFQNNLLIKDKIFVSQRDLNHSFMAVAQKI
jgi:SAM-dependent methyltransferase